MSAAAGLAVTAGYAGRLAAQHRSANASGVDGHPPAVQQHRRGMPAGAEATSPSAGSEVRAFFGALTEGVGLTPAGVSTVGAGRWTIESIHEVQHGAVPVVLSDSRGTRFQVDVLRRDRTLAKAEREPAVAFAQGAALYLSNRGNGRKGTNEEHGLGVMALASALRRGANRGPVPVLLTTFAERRARHPLGAFSAG